jgi:tetratricopeptide (TPR) repeat protein
VTETTVPDTAPDSDPEAFDSVDPVESVESVDLASSVESDDTLAALVEQRDFLLGSLDDLESERAAGDVDEHDYVVLRDDYTARAAAVLRAIDDWHGHRGVAADEAPAAPGAWRRRAAWTLAVVVFGAFAGVLMARAAGNRGSGGFITGGVRESRTQLLAQAQDQFRSGKVDDMKKTYDRLLADNPADDQARAQRAWFIYLSDSVAAPARTELDRALADNGDNLQAHVFRAKVNADDKRFADAVVDLAYFDASTTATLSLIDTVDNMDLRFTVGQGLLPSVTAKIPTNTTTTPTATTITAAGLTVDQVRYAAESLATTEAGVVQALPLYAAVLAARPDDVRALTVLGWSLAGVGVANNQPSFIDRAQVLLDRAVSLAPTNPDALVYRSVLLMKTGHATDAATDLAAFDRGLKPNQLVTLISDLGLREAIAAALGTTPTTATTTTR